MSKTIQIVWCIIDNEAQPVRDWNNRLIQVDEETLGWIEAMIDEFHPTANYFVAGITPSVES